MVSGLLGLAGLTLVPAPPAQAVAQPCDEAGLNAALAAEGTNTFSCGGPTTITISGTKIVSLTGTVLDGGGLLTISGGGTQQVFVVNLSVMATFQNLTIAAGSTVSDGGGIRNYGTLTISNSTISADNTICANSPVNNASQNGVTRPIDGDSNGTATCDIGSYEAPASTAGIPTLSEWAQIGMAALLVGGRVVHPAS